MTQARHRLRAGIQVALEKLPETIKPDNLMRVTAVAGEVMQLYTEFTQRPFTAMTDAAKKEHSALSFMFAKLLDMLHTITGDAVHAFNSGRVEFSLDPKIIELRNKLSDEAASASALSTVIAPYI